MAVLLVLRSGAHVEGHRTLRQESLGLHSRQLLEPPWPGVYSRGGHGFGF